MSHSICVVEWIFLDGLGRPGHQYLNAGFVGLLSDDDIFFIGLLSVEVDEVGVFGDHSRQKRGSLSILVDLLG